MRRGPAARSDARKTACGGGRLWVLSPSRPRQSRGLEGTTHNLPPPISVLAPSNPAPPLRSRHRWGRQARTTILAVVVWDLLYVLAVFVALAAGQAWVRGRSTHRILGSGPHRAPALPEIPVDPGRADAARRFLSTSDTPPDLRMMAVHAPDFDDLGLISRVWSALTTALATRGEPEIPLSEGVRTAWAVRLARDPNSPLVGMPRIIRASADAVWRSVELETIILLREGARPIEWVDRWRVRTLATEPDGWELVSVDDLWRGDLRPQPVAPPRITPRPEGTPAGETLRYAVACALRGDGLAPPVTAESALRNRRGSPVPAATLIDVSVLGPQEVWVEATIDGARVAEAWRVRFEDHGWVVWGPIGR